MLPLIYMQGYSAIPQHTYKETEQILCISYHQALIQMLKFIGSTLILTQDQSGLEWLSRWIQLWSKLNFSRIIHVESYFTQQVWRITLKEKDYIQPKYQPPPKKSAFDVNLTKATFHLDIPSEKSERTVIIKPEQLKCIYIYI